MALIVVRERAATPRLERQARLRAVQRLDLALLVHAQHHGVLGWGQIDAHDIGELLQELGIAGELEAFRQMRLELMFLPDPVDRVLADTLSVRQCNGWSPPAWFARWPR